MIYANYLETSAKAKLALLEEAAGWADARRKEAPKDPNAHYFYSYALGRYSQGISIATALAQGHVGKIREAQRTALEARAQARRRRTSPTAPIRPRSSPRSAASSPA